MIKILKRYLFLLIILFLSIFFFQKTFISGLLPIPSDAIVGLYNPFRDLYVKNYPNGIPFKNFLITDPVRQTYPWKNLSIDLLSKFQLPLWNPYEMAGKPLLANFQSGTFYPLNILLFIKPFYVSWSVFIISQIIMSGIFVFLYLKNLRLDDRASLLAALSYSFSGFSIAWLEWGNILHTALWLPLILLSIDKIFEQKKNMWYLILTLSLTFAFLAGHIQVFFYVFVMGFAYFIFRLFEKVKEVNYVKLAVSIVGFLFLTSLQSFSTLQFINLSARSVDQNPLTTAGWFLPWQNLVQFIAPDFFGNPATLNYWGVWNYAEFVGYVGVITLFLAFLSLLASKRKEVPFFLGVIIVSLIFSLPNPISIFPYVFSIPFISSAQPTRLIFLVSFGLSILGAFGLNTLITDKKPNKKVFVVLTILFTIIFMGLWIVALGKVNLNISPENLFVAQRNLFVPTGILILGVLLIIGHSFIKNQKIVNIFVLLIIIVSFYDLYRFGVKFTPFTSSNYLYPKTSAIDFLLKDKSIFRIASTDSQIFPPNFSTHYKIQTVEGYDPLYLLSYGELISASERGSPNIRAPFGFNRIITPHNIESPIINLLNVKYVLSFRDLKQPQFVKVFQEGRTKIFENKRSFNRAFFVDSILRVSDKQKSINNMFNNDLKNVAEVESADNLNANFTHGKVQIIEYSENKVILSTENPGEGFLVLTDSYYPTWRVKIDGKNAKIYKTDYAFRGVVVPGGNHAIEFYDSIL